jgi:hypothetical protein
VTSGTHCLRCFLRHGGPRKRKDVPTPWVNPTAPGWAPENTDGTAAQIGAARYIWEEAVLTFHTYTYMQQALKKRIITVFDPMHLDILDDNMVGFANITACEMLDHLVMTYGKITAVDLDFLCEQMRFSNRFKIVKIIMNQEALSLGNDSRSMLAMIFFSNWRLHERLSQVE